MPREKEKAHLARDLIRLLDGCNDVSLAGSGH